MIKSQLRISPWWFLALLGLGALVRTAHLFSIPWDTPFRMGGLFYEFSLQILKNHFSLPETIPYYTLDGIPFLYPPLSFYLQAVLIWLFSPAPFITVNLLPALITTLTLPAFFWMVKAWTDDERLQAAALFAYALMPSAFVNQIEGAGLAEACGAVVLIFYLGWLLRLGKRPAPLFAIWAGLFLGLSVLFSPGSAYAAVLLSAIFFVRFSIRSMQERNARAVAWLLLTGATGLVLSAPYWLTLASRHGLGVLIDTFTSQHSGNYLAAQLRYIIAFQPADLITIVSAEGLYGFLFDWLVFGGLLWVILNKHFFEAIFLFVFWLVPREGSWLVALPGALLAGIGLVEFIWPLLQKAFSTRKDNRPALAPGIVVLVLFLLSIGASWNASITMRDQEEWKISPGVLTSSVEMRQLIPEDAHVLVVGNGAFEEWAPSLLQREVLNCEFGAEWQPDELELIYRIKAALHNNDLEAALAVVQQYSGDTRIWLVGSPDQMEDLIAAAGPNLVIRYQAKNADLALASISVVH